MTIVFTITQPPTGGCSNIRPKPLYCPVHDTDGRSPDERQFLPDKQIPHEHKKKDARDRVPIYFSIFMWFFFKKAFGEWGDEDLPKNLPLESLESMANLRYPVACQELNV